MGIDCQWSVAYCRSDWPNAWEQAAGPAAIPTHIEPLRLLRQAMMAGFTLGTSSN
jgi:hypothetical protein